MNIDAIIDYESGELNDKETLELFSTLIKSGMAWKLQGSYGRMASSLIEGSYIDRDGTILKDLEDY
jgi:hypothetical protein